MIFIANKYTTWYYRIINNAVSRNLPTRKIAKQKLGYCERHHIIPTALGGKNLKINLIYLTAHEHFVCHLLLTKMTNGQDKSKMWHAAWGMVNQQTENQNRFKVSGRIYSLIKQNNAIQLSLSKRGVSNLSAKGIPKSQDHCNKISNSLKGENHPNFRKTRPEHSKLMSGSGNPNFGLTGEKNPLYGKSRPDDVKKKIKDNRWDEVRRAEHSARLKNRILPVIVCPHCFKQGKGGAMYKYHFNNCKFLL